MSDHEIFVQCGGLDGDTVMTYIQKYKRIYVYEPTPDQFELTQMKLNDFADVIIRQKGVFDKIGKIKFHAASNPASKGMLGANRIDQEGNIEIEAVRLDDDIAEPITFIAMDVEGAEFSALLGARKHIETTLPKLAICVYHTPGALREICLLIHQFSPRYKIYLRHHTLCQYETVLYAVAE